MTDIISIIPARGGSKGLPGKNIRPMMGEPLIAHTIRHSLNSRRVGRTFVSTDSEEIGQVAGQYGAEVIRRPAAISGDRASSEEALHHALHKLRQGEAYVPDVVVFLQCTSPIRADHDIDAAIELLLTSNSDSLLSVCKFHRFIWRLNRNQPVSFNYDYRSRELRQARSLEFLEVGSIYIFKPWVLEQYNNRLGGRIQLYELDCFSALEIDSLEDFLLCEGIMKHLRGGSPQRVQEERDV